ncbi:hypothetical protein FB451DRAFT_1223027 [Mycena latifolia]|nr:hypothetical protein FB451DRAFT_1223027 [Mycena latifolia]
MLALKIEDFLERRLQTQVFKSSLAKSIHHARTYAHPPAPHSRRPPNNKRALLRRVARQPEAH